MILEKHSRVPRKASQIDLPSPAAKEHPELTPQQLGLYQARLKPLSKVSIKQVLDRYLLDETGGFINFNQNTTLEFGAI